MNTMERVFDRISLLVYQNGIADNDNGYDTEPLPYKFTFFLQTQSNPPFHKFHIIYNNNHGDNNSQQEQKQQKNQSKWQFSKEEQRLKRLQRRSITV